MDPRVQIATTVMKNSLHRGGLFDEAAILVNLSPSRLRHLFTLELGVSPAQYLRTLRMERAKELLEGTWLTMLQIVIRVGLQDRSHFEREFQRLYSVTPAQHRAHLRLSTLASDAMAGSAIFQPQRT